jgi:hypothetical protein
LKNTPIENKELMRQSPHKKDEKPKTSAEVGLKFELRTTFATVAVPK